MPFLSEDFARVADAMGIHPSPRTHYKFTTWLKFNGADVLLVDKRRSEFAPEASRVAARDGLAVVRASQAGMNCINTCRVFGVKKKAKKGGGGGGGGGETWTCDASQFDFINDCQVLAEHFDGCPYGCTQEWGPDIPNAETWDVGRPPQCLVTEERPECEAQHPLTQRICPCVNARG